MKSYLVEINSKSVRLSGEEGRVLVTDSPLRDLRKLFPRCTIERGNSYNWNLALWSENAWTGKQTHLYYVVKKK